MTGLLVLLILAAPASETGTWRQGDPERGGGQLLTARDGTDIRFQLEVWRGAPSYNSGFVQGRFTASSGKATFRSLEPDRPCRLEFTFTSGRVRVRQDPETDCGFGFRVLADGTYRRTSTKPPEFSPGDPRERD